MRAGLRNFFLILRFGVKKCPDAALLRLDGEKSNFVGGLPRLKKDEHGNELCSACLMCELLCPVQAITIKPVPASDKLQILYPLQRRVADELDIDIMKCISCRICEEICPAGAIILTENLPELTSSREQQIYNKQRLLLQ